MQDCPKNKCTQCLHNVHLEWPSFRGLKFTSLVLHWSYKTNADAESCQVSIVQTQLELTLFSLFYKPVIFNCLGANKDVLSGLKCIGDKETDLPCLDFKYKNFI